MYHYIMLMEIGTEIILWSCEIIPSDQLKQRLKNKIDHLIKLVRIK